jgi:hypothetical protein
MTGLSMAKQLAKYTTKILMFTRYAVIVGYSEISASDFALLAWIALARSPPNE